MSLEANTADPADTYPCPYCGQAIKCVARKCRHCGERLGDPDAPGIFRDGRLVVLSRIANLGPVCVKTNEPADQWMTYELGRRPAYLYVLIFLGPLFFIIAMLIAQNKARVRIPLSNRYMARRRRAIAVACLICIAGAAMVVGGIIVGPQDNVALEAWLVASGLVVMMAGGMFGFHVSSPLAVTCITPNHIWLKGFHPAYAADLPRWSTGI